MNIQISNYTYIIKLPYARNAKTHSKPDRKHRKHIHPKIRRVRRVKPLQGQEPVFWYPDSSIKFDAYRGTESAWEVYPQHPLSAIWTGNNNVFRSIEK